MLIYFSHNTFIIKWHLTDRTDNRLQFQADHPLRLLTKNRTDIDLKKLCSFSYFTPNIILGYGFCTHWIFFIANGHQIINDFSGCRISSPSPRWSAAKSVWLETTAIKSTVTNEHSYNERLSLFNSFFTHVPTHI